MAATKLDNGLLKQYLDEGKIVLVDYWAPWCGYCRRIAPAYDKIAREFGDRLVVGKINIDEEPVLARREQIEVIPTLVLYRDGKAVDSIVAPESAARIAEFIRQNLDT